MLKYESIAELVSEAERQGIRIKPGRRKRRHKPGVRGGEPRGKGHFPGNEQCKGKTTIICSQRHNLDFVSVSRLKPDTKKRGV